MERMAPCCYATVYPLAGLPRPFERQGLTCEGVSALNNMGTIDRLRETHKQQAPCPSAAKPTGIAMRAARSSVSPVASGTNRQSQELFNREDEAGCPPTMASAVAREIFGLGGHPAGGVPTSMPRPMAS